MKNCYCLIAFRGGSSGSRTGYPAAISNRSRHAMIHAFKVQRRSAVGRSRAGQRSGAVRARPTQRHRVVVSVDVNGPCDGIANQPSRRPARQRARGPLRPEAMVECLDLRVSAGEQGRIVRGRLGQSWAGCSDPAVSAGGDGGQRPCYPPVACRGARDLHDHVNSIRRYVSSGWGLAHM